MAYDDGLAERIREIFNGSLDVEEKKMFGGLAFMVRGNMCCGVKDDLLMARVGPEQYSKALKRRHAREMDFTGKPLKGFIYVDTQGIENDRDLKLWVGLCQGFVRSLPPK